MSANQIRACQFEKVLSSFVLFRSKNRPWVDRRDGDRVERMESWQTKETKGERLGECKKKVKLENRNREKEKESMKVRVWELEKRKRPFLILAWRLYGKLDISSRSLVGSVKRVEPLGLGGSRIVRSDLGQTAPKAGTCSTNTSVTWERAQKLAFPDLLCTCAWICGPLYALCWPLEKLRSKITVGDFFKLCSL